MKEEILNTTTEQGISRRNFVVAGGLTLGAAALSMGTAAQLASADEQAGIDEPTDTADPTASTELIEGNWAPATRARIQAVIDENAESGRYVVFDWDNTSIFWDIEESAMIYQIEHLAYKITPEDMPDVLATGIPDLDLPMDESLDGVTITPAALIADISSDYTWLYNNYEGLGGDKDLTYIHASNEYQDFAAKLRYMYDALDEYFDASVSYPWILYLYSGMTSDEVRALASASDEYWRAYTYYTKETWTSPLELPGEAGIISVSYITGLWATDELLDLYTKLWANGIDVYAVSASLRDIVVAAAQTFGYDIPEENIYGMQLKTDDAGAYINEYNYDWGGEGMYAQTQAEGKSTIIANFIAPAYNDEGPLMVFGDTRGDYNMMTDWMECGDTELGVIFNRYRNTSDPIWQCSVEAAETIGDPNARFVLQGRNENIARLRPSEYSILLGTTEEVLVREG